MLRWAASSAEGRAARAAFERDVRLPSRSAFERGDDAQAVRLLTGGIAGADAAARISPQAMRRRLDNALAIRMLTLSTAEVQRVPDAGHGAARDNPDDFKRLVLDFLHRHGLTG